MRARNPSARPVKRRKQSKPGEPNYGLVTLNSSRGKGWRVLIKRKTITVGPRDFYESAYGKRGALQAARRWRDEQLPKLPPPKLAREPSLQPGSGNRSGVGGVHLQERKQNGKVTYRWAAVVFDGDGKKQYKSFSVRRYGYRGAYLWACWTRAHLLNETIDLPRLLTPPPSERLRRWLGEQELLRKRVDYVAFKKPCP